MRLLIVLEADLLELASGHALDLDGIRMASILRAWIRQAAYVIHAVPEVPRRDALLVQVQVASVAPSLAVFTGTADVL